MNVHRQSPQLAGLVLAAGASLRFGAPKPLALFRDVPLVRHATTLLAGLCPAGVYVVAGTAEQAIRGCVAADGVQVIGNPDWASGLASSLACGIRALPVGADAALVIPCDLPAVTAEDLARLVAAWRAAPELMAAAEFDGHPAPPAIFPRAVWSQLALLRGDQGARAVLESAAQRSAVAMPSAALDADTPEELARLGRTLG
ncbi:MAG: nucleotidyltransferase family protein [Chromatiales bacterium]|jgi:molybdenum cofactor cytidylyltransferase|nr:nucleotidyltransferase family protein [Chromatiales bacterium]